MASMFYQTNGVGRRGDGAAARGQTNLYPAQSYNRTSLKQQYVKREPVMRRATTRQKMAREQHRIVDQTAFRLAQPSMNMGADPHSYNRNSLKARPSSLKSEGRYTRTTRMNRSAVMDTRFGIPAKTENVVAARAPREVFDELDKMAREQNADGTARFDARMINAIRNKLRDPTSGDLTEFETVVYAELMKRAIGKKTDQVAAAVQPPGVGVVQPPGVPVIQPPREQKYPTPTNPSYPRVINEAFGTIADKITSGTIVDADFGAFNNMADGLVYSGHITDDEYNEIMDTVNTMERNAYARQPTPAVQQTPAVQPSGDLINTRIKVNDDGTVSLSAVQQTPAVQPSGDLIDTRIKVNDDGTVSLSIDPHLIDSQIKVNDDGSVSLSIDPGEGSDEEEMELEQKYEDERVDRYPQNIKDALRTIDIKIQNRTITEDDIDDFRDMLNDAFNDGEMDGTAADKAYDTLSEMLDRAEGKKKLI